MCGRDGCGHHILSHVFGWAEDDTHCIHPGCDCTGYVTEPS